ncbi:2-C-methyl-D-erythritol 4-phosphate cytidylyltransferase [Clostridiaceae bacterium 35-E11]
MRNGKFVSVIIAAAGQGKRMGAPVNKQYLILLDKPVLVHTISKFEMCEIVDEIIVVVHPEEKRYCEENIITAYGFKKVSKVVQGGKERQESIYNGLKSVKSACDIVVIHDGARPFVREKNIVYSVDAAITHKAVGVGVPVKDTIKVVNEKKQILHTPDRKTLWAIQTPQVFEYKLLLKAHEKAREEGYLGTDDTVLIEKIKQEVYMIMGNYDNIKITTPEDLYIGEIILRHQQ